MLEPVTEPVRRLIAKYESRIERLEKANGRLCEQINSMPEIVRCRDCTYNAKDTDGICYRFDHEHFNQPDGFCAWGKRKEGRRSMLTAQVDELREAAVICNLAGERETAKLLREAVYTIESLRDRLQAATLEEREEGGDD